MNVCVCWGRLRHPKAFGHGIELGVTAKSSPPPLLAGFQVDCSLTAHTHTFCACKAKGGTPNAVGTALALAVNAGQRCASAEVVPEKTLS